MESDQTNKNGDWCVYQISLAWCYLLRGIRTKVALDVNLIHRPEVRSFWQRLPYISIAGW
jgi:hypothetical protein